MGMARETVVVDGIDGGKRPASGDVTRGMGESGLSGAKAVGDTARRHL